LLKRKIAGVPVWLWLVGGAAVLVLRSPSSTGRGYVRPNGVSNAPSYGWDPVSDPNSQYYSPWQNTPGTP
jgi:hypothetical protein